MLDPQYKAQREAEVNAKLAELNRNAGAGAALRFAVEHEAPELQSRVAPLEATEARAARQEDGDDGTGEGGSEFADVDAVGRVALSSEAPIRRRNWWGDVWVEVLDHGEGAVRLERAARGMAMLAEHERTRLAGKWTEAAIDDDRVLRARPQFSRNAFAKEVETDVLDGIRSTTSIGYLVHKAQLEEVDDDGVETWRFTDWEPLEASWEVIPADISVGVGRSAAAPAATLQPAEGPKELTMGKTDERTAAGASGGQDKQPTEPTTVSVADVRKQETTRIRDLRNLGKAHGLDDARVEAWIEQDVSFADAAREVTQERAKAPATPTTTPPEQERNPLGLSRDDQRRYSVRAAIMQQLQRDEGGEAPGFETEVSRALEAHLPADYKRQGGLLVPTGILGRRAQQQRDLEQGREVRAGLEVQTTNKGEELVFTEYAGFIGLLRSRAMVLQLGARYLPGLVGNASFVKQTAAATASWVAENPGSDPSDTELSLDVVTLSPKTLLASTFFTRQLLRQAVIAVDAMVEEDLVAIHARGIDLAAIHGSGSSNQPTGLYSATGVNAVAFGGAITYAKVVDMETEVAAADADIGAMAYLTTPQIRGVAKQTEMFADTNGQPIWTGSVQDGEMNGYRAAASTQVSATLGATPTPDEHGLLFGVWSELLIGEWGMLELVVDPYSKKKQGLIEVSSFQMADIQVRHGEAFSKATGLTLS